jgi:hypothetical protein
MVYLRPMQWTVHPSDGRSDDPRPVSPRRIELYTGSHNTPGDMFGEMRDGGPKTSPRLLPSQFLHDKRIETRQCLHRLLVQ